MLRARGLDLIAGLSAVVCLGFLFRCAMVSAMAGDLEQSPRQSVVALPGSRSAANGCLLVDQSGKPLSPGSIVFVGNDIYCLDASRLWLAPNAVPNLPSSGRLSMIDLGPKMPIIDAIPVQEFLNFAYAPAFKSLVVLDKSGDVYEFDLAKKWWHVLGPNSPMGSPDPEYIDMAVSGSNIVLLDPERNQIWRFPAVSRRYFRDVMPWRVKPGDVSVANGIGIAYDGRAWVLRKDGLISKYAADSDRGMAKAMPFHWQSLSRMRPSRFYTAANAPLYAVERENNRVVAVDKDTGQHHQFVFPADSNLRGLAVTDDGFWVIDGSRLVHKLLAQPDADSAACHPRTIDSRLAGLVMPLPGAHMPTHPGVWAGSRRLYRFGVHHGTDFFDDQGTGTHVKMDTPVFAADSGQVTRADIDFRDMDAAQYVHVISQCQQEHVSSETNENFLRGRQIWIDHGKGLITRYAHLDKIEAGVRSGIKVSARQLIGYVGVSGTGENLPGRVKYPHLHFEIFLDGKYLGYGLTPSETIGVYEDIFGSGPRG